jgi:RNAse (barnase) inhibitor barstar
MNLLDMQSDKVVLETTQPYKDILSTLRNDGYFAVLVDRALVFNKETLLHALYQSCAFPAYFGFNWDALKDIFSDSSWTTQSGQEYKGLVLVFRNMAVLEKRASDVAETFLDITRDVAEHRQQKGLAPLRVVLVRDGNSVASSE